MDQSLIGGAALWLALNGVAVWQLHGTWRKAALVPVAIMGLAVAVAALGDVRWLRLYFNDPEPSVSL